ncbi:MAG: hypothetical protein RL364_1047 [Pseudomonadota bacterium]|jgi:MFS family permease
MPRGFLLLVSAQFFSALADHALLVVGIFYLQSHSYAGWWAPLLKFCFTLSYVVLAPVLGPLADAFIKSRLMAFMNGVKLLGVGLLLAGIHPLLAFTLIGMAASAYAPAKYGLVTESVPPSLLIRANAWLEVAVVLSVIFGTASGGLIISAAQQLSSSLQMLDTSTWSLMAVLLIYLLAGLLNAFIRTDMSKHPVQPLQRTQLSWTHFLQRNRQLWTDPLGRLSLYVTTLYWGVGAVIQFAVLVWAQRNLNMPLQQAALLQALVAVGVVAGAVLAGKFYKLHSARKVLPLGLVLAACLPLIAVTHWLWLALPLMLIVGITGGMLMVPMNALLQHRGRHVLSTGQSIAVQGFNENLSVLVMLATYSGLLALELPIWLIMCLVSTLLVVGMWPVTRNRRPSTPRT